MKLNSILKNKLGVITEDKYNSLATEEILENARNYPLIYDKISFLSENEIKSDTFSFDEIFELYRAFVFAFAKENNDKPMNVTYASFGIECINEPDVRTLTKPYSHCIEKNYIRVYPKKTECVIENLSKTECSTIRINNEQILIDISDSFKFLCINNVLFMNRFENEELTHRCFLSNGETVYYYDVYEIRVGKNVFRFFSTERGFDALSPLRLPLIEKEFDVQTKPRFF